LAQDVRDRVHSKGALPKGTRFTTDLFVAR